MHIRDTPERDERMARLKEATDEKTQAKAVDTAIKHYLADLENKRWIARKVSPEIADELSTPWLPLDSEVSVGRTG